MTQLQLVWDSVNPYDVERAKKLTKDLKAIYDIMSDHKLHLVADISRQLNLPECSVSAQLRHLRKPKYGAFKIKLVKITKGLSGYVLEKE